MLGPDDTVMNEKYLETVADRVGSRGMLCKHRGGNGGTKKRDS